MLCCQPKELRGMRLFCEVPQHSWGREVHRRQEWCYNIAAMGLQYHCGGTNVAAVRLQFGGDEKMVKE